VVAQTKLNDATIAAVTRLLAAWIAAFDALVC
jgi:hypothetical protein